MRYIILGVLCMFVTYLLGVFITFDLFWIDGPGERLIILYLGIAGAALSYLTDSI